MGEGGVEGAALAPGRDGRDVTMGPSTSTSVPASAGGQKLDFASVVAGAREHGSASPLESDEALAKYVLYSEGHPQPVFPTRAWGEKELDLVREVKLKLREDEEVKDMGFPVNKCGVPLPWGSIYRWDDAKVSQYLHSADYKVLDAVQGVKDSVNFRSGRPGWWDGPEDAYGPLRILPTQDPRVAKWADAVTFAGYGSDGRATLLLALGPHMKAIMEDFVGFQTALVSVADALAREVLVPPLDQWTSIIDLQGVSVFGVESAKAKHLFRVLDRFFPCLAKRLFVINIPMLISSLVNMFILFAHPETQAKIKIYSYGFEAQLAEIYPKGTDVAARYGLTDKDYAKARKQVYARLKLDPEGGEGLPQDHAHLDNGGFPAEKKRKAGDTRVEAGLLDDEDVFI